LILEILLQTAERLNLIVSVPFLIRIIPHLNLADIMGNISSFSSSSSSSFSSFAPTTSRGYKSGHFS
jgi:hypothetical protein